MNRKLNRKKWLVFAAACASVATLAFALLTKASASEEIPKLATLMEWKPGMAVADIGAGDGSYAFAALEHIGATGKVFATEIDAEKLKALRAEIKKRNLQNVVVVESGDAETNLPASCCDAIFLRRVYHHLSKPLEFDASLLRSLSPAANSQSSIFRLIPNTAK
jgi:SAM-dependent methyltransferase